MPSYSVVYEDTSPFFTYTGAWTSGSSRSDDFADRYSESSFTLTQTQGNTFSFKFYGTEVSISGAKRGNHGLYQVTLDGTTSSEVTGAGQDQFQTSLYSATVPKGMHTVTMVNRENKFLDIDFVSWTASVGLDDEPLIVNTWQDSHPAFVYSPANAWTSGPPSVGTFAGATGHGSSTPGSSVQLTFQGDAIAIYGPSGPNGAASYSVQVGADAPSFHSALKEYYRPRQLLYYGANLGPGSHNITLKLESTSDRSQMLAIDYAEIYTTASLGGSFDSATASESSSSGPPVGLIVGIAITGTLAALALGLLVYLFILYKKGRFNFAPTKSTEPDLQSYDGVSYPTGQANYAPSMVASHFTSFNPSYPAGSTPTTGYQSTQFASAPPIPQQDSSSIAASSSTNPSQGGAIYRPRSIRKNQLHTTNRDSQSEGPAVPAPPPAYMT